MTSFLAGILAALSVALVRAWQRGARLRYLVDAEELRIRLSKLRHELVIYASTDAMGHDEKRGVEFLYNASSILLRYPALYRQISDTTCRELILDRAAEPPKVRRKDFDRRTRQLLKEFVSIADQMVSRFASPIFLVLAFISGKAVLEMALDVARSHRSETAPPIPSHKLSPAKLITEKKAIRQWRDAGERILNPPTKIQLVA